MYNLSAELSDRNLLHPDSFLAVAVCFFLLPPASDISAFYSEGQGESRRRAR